MNRGYTSEVIDLLELAPETAGSPDRAVAPHATFDASVGYDLHTLSAIPLKLTVSVLNIFDTLYLYKFESTFGGTHFGVPRTIAARIDVTY
jgi:outer membrane receptor for Fe3+-dicitrate